MFVKSLHSSSGHTLAFQMQIIFILFFLNVRLEIWNVYELNNSCIHQINIYNNFY